MNKDEDDDKELSELEYLSNECKLIKLIAFNFKIVYSLPKVYTLI